MWLNTAHSIGWSAKAVQWPISPGAEFALVIQRADIFKKAKVLGFKKLGMNSPPKQLGKALLKHWNDKVETDSNIQHVRDRRVCILLKSDSRRTFAYSEFHLATYAPTDLCWHWTNSSKVGLQGVQNADNFCVYRWYPNQKQFFERFRLPEDALIFELELRRVRIGPLIDHILRQLHSSA